MSKDKILYARDNGTLILKFVGNVRFNMCSAMDRFIEIMLQDNELTDILIDVSEATSIDSTALGGLAKVAIQAEEKLKKKPFLFVLPAIDHIIKSVNFDQIFIVVRQSAVAASGLAELPSKEESELELERRVLEAHKTLMAMNAQNRDKFKDVVKMLEQHMKDRSS